MNDVPDEVTKVNNDDRKLIAEPKKNNEEHKNKMKLYPTPSLLAIIINTYSAHRWREHWSRLLNDRWVSYGVITVKHDSTYK
jgi:hypothetical protein